MGDHPNVALFRKTMVAFNVGDTTGLATLLADDVVWHQIGGAMVNGHEAVAEGILSGMTGVDFSGEVHDVVANDDHLVGLVNVHVKAGDQEISYRNAEIMQMSDGKITERWAFSDDTQAITEFFSQFDT